MEGKWLFSVHVIPIFWSRIIFILLPNYNYISASSSFLDLYIYIYLSIYHQHVLFFFFSPNIQFIKMAKTNESNNHLAGEKHVKSKGCIQQSGSSISKNYLTGVDPWKTVCKISQCTLKVQETQKCKHLSHTHRLHECRARAQLRRKQEEMLLQLEWYWNTLTLERVRASGTGTQ